jgi:hypothetical protein
MTKGYSAERRKAVRHETSMKGILDCSNGSRSKVEIVDLSTSGFNAEMAQPGLTADSGFAIRMPGLESLGAELCWTASERAGFRFSHPLHPAVLDHVVRAHPATVDDE